MLLQKTNFSLSLHLFPIMLDHSGGQISHIFLVYCFPVWGGLFRLTSRCQVVEQGWNLLLCVLPQWLTMTWVFTTGRCVGGDQSVVLIHQNTFTLVPCPLFNTWSVILFCLAYFMKLTTKWTRSIHAWRTLYSTIEGLLHRYYVLFDQAVWCNSLVQRKWRLLK